MAPQGHYNLQTLEKIQKGPTEHTKKKEALTYCNKWEKIVLESLGAYDLSSCWIFAVYIVDIPQAHQSWAKVVTLSTAELKHISCIRS